MHAAVLVALRHLLMDDAAAGRHPLHVARADRAAVAQAVAVLDGARQHVGDGLDAAVRMPGEAGQVIVGTIVAEVVEQQERIELLVLPNPNARRRWTPAPSMVGCDSLMCLTGRMDMTLLCTLDARARPQDTAAGREASGITNTRRARSESSVSFV